MNLRECLHLFLAGIVCSVIAIATPAQSALLFQDTFNNVSNSDAYSGTDYGVNKELAARQSGPSATMTYTRYDGGAGWNGATQAYHSSFGKTLTMFAYSSSGTPYVVGTKDFARDVSISALLDPSFYNSDPTGWVAISTRLTSATPGAVNLSMQTGVSLRVQSNGGVTVLVDGGVAGTAAVAAVSTYQTNMTLLGNLLTVTINNVLVDLNGAAAGTSLTIAGAAGTHNYVGLSAKSNSGTQTSTFDNLTIESIEVPEPATMGLLTLGGMALLGRRNRNRN